MKPSKALWLACLLTSIPSLHSADPTWEWVRTVAGTGDDIGAGVCIDDTGFIYFAGAMEQGALVNGMQVSGANQFLTKYNSSGAFYGARLGYTSSSGNAPRLTATPDGDIVAVGGFYVSLNFGTTLSAGGNQGSTFIARFNNQLQMKWGQSFTPGSWGGIGLAPIATPQGDIVFAAGGTSVSYAGTALNGVNNTYDLFVFKTSETGSLRTLKRLGGQDTDIPQAVAVDSTGNIYVGGFAFSRVIQWGPITTNHNAWAIGTLGKAKPTGDADWIKLFGIVNPAGGSFGNCVSALKCAMNDDLIAAGYTNSVGSMQPSVGDTLTGFLTRLTPAGGTVWTKSVTNLWFHNLTVDASDNIFSVGTFFGTIVVDGRTFTSRGGSDVFVGKFSPSGALIWAQTAGGGFNDDIWQVAVAPDSSVYVAGTLREGATFGSIFMDGKGLGDAFLAKISDPTASKLPSITNQPSASATYFGKAVTLSAGVKSDVPVTYQWFKNGVAISGQTSATLNFSSVRPTDDAYYFVEVTNQYGTVRSDSVRLLVRGDAPVSVTTLAGNGAAGDVDAAKGSDVRFKEPDSPAIHADGSIIIPDSLNHAIRVLDPSGAVGTISGKGPNAAGLTNGPASAATFNVPLSVAIAPSWDIFVADTFDFVIRKISPYGTRTVSTYAGNGQKGIVNGPVATAQFAFPNDLVADPAGNLYVTEFENHVVRKISADGMVTTIAGTGVAGWRDGAAGQALFNSPAGIARDSIGNLYITEWSNHTIRKLGTNGLVTTIAGQPGQSGFVDGPALTAAKLNVPNGIAIDAKGNILFTETGNHSVRRLDPLGDVLTLVGAAGQGFQDGDRLTAKMFGPGGIAAHPDGSLIVADTYNHAIRKIIWQTNAAPTEAVVLIDLNPSITLYGVTGRTYQIQFTESLVTPAWITLGEVTLTDPVETYFDTQPVTRRQRYYRAILKP